MCLIKKHMFPRYAFKDITVYKIVAKVGDTYFTPCQLCIINIGETYFSSKNIFKAIFNITVEGEGIHSYSLLEQAEYYKPSPRTIVQCVIPKGSWYYLGEFNEVASNKLKYVKVLD